MNHHFFNGIGGYHYIATGMHWLPTDLADQMYQRNSPNYTTQDASAYYKEKWGPIVERLNKKKERWKEGKRERRKVKQREGKTERGKEGERERGKEGENEGGK